MDTLNSQLAAAKAKNDQESVQALGLDLADTKNSLALSCIRLLCLQQSQGLATIRRAKDMEIPWNQSRR